MKQSLIILTLIVSCHLNVAGQFKEGAYYRKNGTKVSGFIEFNYGKPLSKDKSYGNCYITFKPEKRGKKINLTTKEVCCFTMEEDSFAIIKNFSLNANRFEKYPQDFAKVIIPGKISLYQYYSEVPQGAYSITMTEWVIGNGDTFDGLYKNKFDELMQTYISDYPELLQKVESGELGYNDFKEIIQMYNDYWKNK